MNDRDSNTPLALMVGLPDDMMVNVWPRSRNGDLDVSVPGNARLADDLPQREQQRLARTYFGPDIPIQLPAAVRQNAVVNAIADPDVSSASLRVLEAFLQDGACACFNHPTAVLECGRERVAEKLSAVPGMLVPRTIRRKIGEPADLLREAAENGIGYPLIVRIAGSHRGATTVKIDRPEDAAPALRAIPWGGRELYVTEYVDYRDDDGLFRKMRIIFVGKQRILRHFVIAGDWQVHRGDRLMQHVNEEATMLCNFDSTLLPQLRGTLESIAEAMDLDFFGIDCKLRPDGSLLMFETNAMMNTMYNDAPSPNCWDAPVRRIREAVGALLFEPARWRHPPRRRSIAQ
ncbi:MAG TPA: hypothetical protein VFX38_06355 [Gammaproteobacteria bacterium]|nr:hypothetical protein [Gammaproteobacteria bacterium]